MACRRGPGGVHEAEPTHLDPGARTCVVHGAGRTTLPADQCRWAVGDPPLEAGDRRGGVSVASPSTLSVTIRRGTGGSVVPTGRTGTWAGGRAGSSSPTVRPGARPASSGTSVVSSVVRLAAMLPASTALDRAPDGFGAGAGSAAGRVRGPAARARSAGPAPRPGWLRGRSGSRGRAGPVAGGVGGGHGRWLPGHRLATSVPMRVATRSVRVV